MGSTRVAPDALGVSPAVRRGLGLCWGPGRGGRQHVSPSAAWCPPCPRGGRTARRSCCLTRGGGIGVWGLSDPRAPAPAWFLHRRQQTPSEEPHCPRQPAEKRREPYPGSLLTNPDRPRGGSTEPAPARRLGPRLRQGQLERPGLGDGRGHRRGSCSRPALSTARDPGSIPSRPFLVTHKTCPVVSRLLDLPVTSPGPGSTIAGHRAGPHGPCGFCRAQPLPEGVGPPLRSLTAGTSRIPGLPSTARTPPKGPGVTAQPCPRDHRASRLPRAVVLIRRTEGTRPFLSNFGLCQPQATSSL